MFSNTYFHILVKAVEADVLDRWSAANAAFNGPRMLGTGGYSKIKRLLEKSLVADANKMTAKDLDTMVERAAGLFEMLKCK